MKHAPLSKTQQIAIICLEDLRKGKWRSAEEIAAYIGCSRKLVYDIRTRLRSRGLLPRRKQGEWNRGSNAT